MASANSFPLAGALDTPVKFLQAQDGRNAINERVKSFVELTTRPVFAKREDVSGSESLEDGTVIALQVRRYFIRYRQDLYNLSTDVIIEDDGVKWNVNYAGKHGRNEFIEYKCSKRE